jgi:hypothetical protein
MKAMPTLEGGLRIDTENAADWEVLRTILNDANGCGIDLASRLGGMISEEAGAQDWEDYVVPDLREAFQDELAEVGASIESAIFQAEEGPGPIWITREDVSAWYSALNQARLAIENRYSFGAGDSISPEGLTPSRRAAFVRSRFYCAIQGMLLEHVMR